MATGAESIGAVIREMRTGAGLTLKAVASNAGTSIAYLSKVERGEFFPSREYAVKVLNFITTYEMNRKGKAA
ncbi:helix-turn-helix domain-containing protein [Microbacterium paludicola]|uniref:helix-turn-helix domain-containing protein n=1 Tax=Microbacterium paludicola TaxID=300019 RepID=UPI0011AA551C|nr:helix-turn-helix transcriptional regulator [Microbacterium paludicola]